MALAQELHMIMLLAATVGAALRPLCMKGGDQLQERINHFPIKLISDFHALM